MYELVNTSLPNGLIAGTHGFATVAMTKGVSDILRGRLEALCAYTHRTSVHDATYYQQNPVNWFHVTLPQGEHVVGRVAPSDFDYTGRTNRLARIRVFAANEMPAVGGAEILAKEKHWFSQPWQGDPRYLEEDRNTGGHLRMLNPSQLSSAPAWDALFGSSGSRYAQQVAWQVEKNLSAGGKTIYFKTSTAWDVSGEKLLGLFVDVINLLPVEMRPRVTFSTYPVSLPGGTGCNLRGVYDRDKFFDASSATQAWVDCESVKVVHAEMLPTSGSARKSETKTEKGEIDAGGDPNRLQTASSASKLGVRRPPTSGGDPNSYRNLLAPQKKGPDMFIVGLVVVGAVVLLAACGLLCWVWQNEKPRTENRKDAAEEKIKNLEIEDAPQECPANVISDAKLKDKDNTAEQSEYDKAYRRLEDVVSGKILSTQDVKNALEQLNVFSNIKVNVDHNRIVEKAKKCIDVLDRFSKLQKRVANLSDRAFESDYLLLLKEAQKDVVIVKEAFKSLGLSTDMIEKIDVLGDDVNNKIARKEKAIAEEKNKSIANAYRSARIVKKRSDLDEDMKLFTNDACRVYYFDINGSLQNAPVKYWHKVIGGTTIRKLKYGARLEKEVKDIVKDAHKVALWYNGEAIYFHLLNRSFEHAICSSNDVVSLDNGIFAGKEMRTLYEKSGASVSYKVRVSKYETTVSASTIEIADINKKIQGEELSRLEKELEKHRRMVDDFDKNKKKHEDRKHQLDDGIRYIEVLEKQIEEKVDRLTGKSKFGGELKKDEKKKLKEEVANLRDDVKKKLEELRMSDIDKCYAEQKKLVRLLNKKKLEEDVKKCEADIAEVTSGRRDIGYLVPGMKIACELLED